MNYYNDFVEYIINNYSNARKIVEVGAGKNLAVYNELRRKLKGAN